jgi:hypothetical protein
MFGARTLVCRHRVPMDTTIANFDFGDAPHLKAILEEYRQHTERALRAESYLGVVVGCSSIGRRLVDLGSASQGARGVSFEQGSKGQGREG